jgi:hypothetical protein
MGCLGSKEKGRTKSFDNPRKGSEPKQVPKGDAEPKKKPLYVYSLLFLDSFVLLTCSNIVMVGDAGVGKTSLLLRFMVCTIFLCSSLFTTHFAV